MQRLCTVAATVIFCLLSFSSLMSQADNARVIKPYNLSISYNKTSNLIFPYAIKSVDRGSGDILAQKTKGIENILQLKAGVRTFVQTNLTVVTSDGKFYSFLLNYSDSPSSLNLSFGSDEVLKTGRLTVNDKALLTDMPVDEAVLKQTAEEIGQLKPFLRIREKEQKMSLSLDGIWLKDSLMWFSLQLKNKSLIAYPVSSVRFFVKDKKRGKRTSVQETEITPLYKNSMSMITGKKSARLQLAFLPFTIPKSKELIIHLAERNGGRALILKVGHRKLFKAKAI